MQNSVVRRELREAMEEESWAGMCYDSQRTAVISRAAILTRRFWFTVKQQERKTNGRQ